MEGGGVSTAKLQYIRHEHNTGVSPAWNKGIWEALSAGHHRVLVMNQDAVVAPDAIGNLLAWEAEHLLFPTCVAAPVANMDRLARYPRHHLIGPSDFACFLMTDYVWERALWFDPEFFPAFFEDWDYMMRLERLGIRYGGCRDALMIHQGSTSIHEGGVKNDQFEANKALFEAKWKGQLPKFFSR